MLRVETSFQDTPGGGELDCLDKRTLSHAVKARRSL
jgi:hypothetical protein